MVKEEARNGYGEKAEQELVKKIRMGPKAQVEGLATDRGEARAVSSPARPCPSQRPPAPLPAPSAGAPTSSGTSLSATTSAAYTAKTQQGGNRWRFSAR